MMPRAVTGISIIALILATSACLEDGDRGNPLDPLSPNFEDAGLVSGRVVDRSLGGIPAGIVTLTPGGQNATTDNTGSFVIDAVPTGSYTVTVEAAGYAGRSDTITVSPGRPATSNFELNGLPVLLSWSINTAHISRWWPLEDLFQIEITAAATDADGVFDIDRVWLEIPDYSYSDTLRATQTAGAFAKTLADIGLPTATIHALLGRAIHLSVRDRLDETITSPGVQLIRVIDETPAAVDAAYQTGPGDCLQGQSGSGIVPLIEWEPLFLPYPFTHRVDIIRVDSGLESLVERIENIPSGQTSAVATPLPPGEYYWTVAVVDEYLNRSRSKQVGVCVIP